MGHFEKGRWIEDPIDVLENMVKASEKIEAMRQQIIEGTKIDPRKSYLLCPSVNGYSLIELPHMRDLWR